MVVSSGPKKICIVSNKIDLTRDYSEFVDSCDVVYRVSKMENLDGGLSGSKIDYVVVSTFEEYYKFSKDERHLSELATAKTIYLHNPVKWPYYKRWNQYLINELPSSCQYDFFPDEIYDNNWQQFTTFGIAIMIASKKFPNDRLYLLGDKDTSIRTYGIHPNVEMPFINHLVNSGKATYIFDKEAQGYDQFSKPVSKERLDQLLDFNLTKNHLMFYERFYICDSLGRTIELHIHDTRFFDATNNRFGTFPESNRIGKKIKPIIKLGFDDGSYEIYRFDPLYGKHSLFQRS